MKDSAKNTDREIWRKVSDDYYSPSIHVTFDGRIGINVGGRVIVATIEKWHRALIESSGEKASGAGKTTGESAHRSANTNLVDRCSDEPLQPLPPDLQRFYEKKGYPAPSPAPLPSEVEEAMERMGRCIGAAFSRRADLLFMARLGADHERDKDNAALAVIRAALTKP
jgi:hypothetical protein